ncbi:MAG: Rieske 2Fe-2S domain-containing protein [Alphaproteobacteria bacterium]|nr:Rieske 2Fe-2S domain-containing protein [Alphaproteobacteria bacterium]
MVDRECLIEMAKDALAHGKAGTISQAPEVMKIKADVYTDDARFEQEKKLIFRRMPLMLAPSAELPNPGDYKAMDAVGVPVLLTRGKDGKVRAFLNSCTHRGTAIAQGCGNTSRFVCGYHGWTFNREGELIGVASREDFGEVNTDELGLKPFPVLEKAGLIWAILDPDSTLDINTFLSGYDKLLEGFGFENWTFFESRTLVGPNWKIAYDGYLDFYHLPVLHADTFGRNIPNKALFYSFGPHTRVNAPSTVLPLPDGLNLTELEEKDSSEWPTEALMNGVWTIFPHISIATFYGGARGVMISQLFPGDKVGESFTTQMYLSERKPTEEEARGLREQFKLLEYVVQHEDYGTGLRQQRALDAGMTENVYFGRNEGGGQVFHGWVQKILDTANDDLNSLFTPVQQAAE